MKVFIKLSSAVYHVLLAFYPPDVRRAFGSEMADTFARQLADAWTEERLAGVVHVWSLTLLELTSIALPQQLARPAMTVPAASLVATSALFFSLLWAFEHSLVLNAWYHGIFGGGRH